MRFFVLLLIPLLLTAGTPPSPEEFLGYPLGERFTSHEQIVAYVTAVAAASDRVAVETYGETYEHRPLMVAYVSSPAHLKRRDEIQAHQLQRTGLRPGTAPAQDPVVVWLTYNIHGNEANSSEAALATLYALIQPENASWLDSVLVIIDPCANPDGRERYVNWQRRAGNINPAVAPAGREHREPWPGSRSNHYYFDLNRDWIWQTQTESVARNRLYNRWLPQVHVDFHEQGVNAPYYFAPAAEPYHEAITPWQKALEKQIGQANAARFDTEGWRYFTREEFDLLYPGYGDTYPMFQGAVGMTYEQAGGRRAGRAVLTETGDTLRLQDRLAHHTATGLTTIATVSGRRGKILQEFSAYFQTEDADGAYLLRSDKPAILRSLARWLDANQIQYGTPAITQKRKGRHYATDQVESVTARPGDMVIPARQPKATLVRILMEAETTLHDSLTYDLTAWALPYVYNVSAWALNKSVKLTAFPFPELSWPTNHPYGYAVSWGDATAVTFLTTLLQQDVILRYATEPFTVDQTTFGRGSLILLRDDNHRMAWFDSVVVAAANDVGLALHSLSGGQVERGRDFGSSAYRVIIPPTVAVLAGRGRSAMALGEVWYYFEQDLAYPLTVLMSDNLRLTDYDVLILPARRRGGLADDTVQELKTWVQTGGTLLVLGSALEDVAGQEGFALTRLAEEDDGAPEQPRKRYGDRHRDRVSKQAFGAMIRIHLDPTHPLAFGYDTTAYLLKQNRVGYAWLKSGWNVGVMQDETDIVSGFVGSAARRDMIQALIFGVEPQGRGTVIYLVDSPLFRGFLTGAKGFMANALFFLND